ncbi:MAG: benzoate-CoA ligase family protein [Chloroflexi bacterium]|nr:benzoate-CoA ligase family protein [Chloroflexota bacterium]
MHSPPGARLNLTAYLLDHHLAAGRADRVALWCEDRPVTYGQLIDQVDRAAAALRALNVQPEQRVAVLLPDSLAFVTAFLGAIKIGAVAVPLNTALRATDYAHVLDDSGAVVLVAAPALLPLVAAALPRCRRLREVILADGGPDGWEARLARAVPLRAPAETHAEDMAFWLYSSGTTGLPKGVVHLHRDVLPCLRFPEAVCDLREQDTTFAVSKLFFAYALGNNLFAPLRLGASALLYPERPEPRAVLDYLRRRQPTVLFSVPSFYAALLRVADAPPDALGSVRLAVSAGEVLSPEVYRRWRERFGVELVDGIGTTENIYTFISNRPGAVRPGSSGQPVPGFAVRLVDDAGRDVGVDEPGYLLLRSESAAAFYWHDFGRTRQAYLGEWLRTGDVYRRDADGYYWHCGRADDIFKVDGQWVWPSEIEHLLCEHPAVAEAAVVAATAEDGLVKPRAFVRLREGWTPSAELAAALQAHVRERTAPYKFPRWIEFVAELPRTATGKVQRYKLREDRAPRSTSREHPEPPPGEGS